MMDLTRQAIEEGYKAHVASVFATICGDGSPDMVPRFVHSMRRAEDLYKATVAKLDEDKK